MKERAVILARVSTSKQASENDSIGMQLKEGIDFVESMGWEVAKTMELVESGRAEEREFFNEVIDYCTNPKNNISYLVARDISRFTRGGTPSYTKLKEKLEKAGVQLQDTQGTIQPKKNTMDKYGLKYDWSIYSPSEAEEFKQASQAKDQVRQALTNMIGAEIEYARMGYWNRRPPYGYMNKKIQTEKHGKRNILAEKRSESVFIKKIFTMRSSGLYSDKEIVKEVNDLGYKSRLIYKRDKKTRKVVGRSGERTLTVKQLQAYVSNPAYAGIICEAWTHYRPVSGKFEGLVSTNTFNMANIGKVLIEINDSSVSIKYGETLEDKKIIQRRSRNNLMYPFKNVVMCPKCGSKPKGSASTGKRGKKYPAYHCSKRHEYWRIPRNKFHQTVYDFIKLIRFKQAFINLFESSFMEVWEEKIEQGIEQSQQAEKNVSELLLEQKDILKSIRLASSKIVIASLEKDYEEMEQKIRNARKHRNKVEKKELDAKLAVKSARYLMEHLEELLIDEDNPLQQQHLFGLLFNEFPTYNDLVSGTPKLSLAFKLNQKKYLSKSEMVTPWGIDPQLSGYNISIESLLIFFSPAPNSQV